MILAAHQLHYLPGLSYLDKIDRSDCFVILDDVQYEKNGWQNRNRIWSPKGWQWLTVPVHAHLSDRILDVQIKNETSWQKDHLKSMELHYHKTPHFSLLWDRLKGIYEKEWVSLAPFSAACLDALFQAVGLEKKKRIYSSALNLKTHTSQRLVDCCKHFGADTYLSGDGAQAYLDLALFEKEKIRVVFQNFSHPVYRQFQAKEGDFVDHLSCVDLIFNHGKESLGILRKIRKGADA